MACRCALPVLRRRPGAAARCVFFPAAPSGSKNISRPSAICAAAVLPSPFSTGAGRACRIAQFSDRHKGHIGSFSEFDTDLETFMREVVLPDCPPPMFALAHSMGADDSHSRRAPWPALVRPYRAVGADARHCADHIRRRSPLLSCGECGSGAWAPCTFPAAILACSICSPFAGNILTSDPVRYARNAAVIEAEPALGLGGPTVAWCDAAFHAMRATSDPKYPARHPPADSDRRRRSRCHRVKHRDRRFRSATSCRFASRRQRLPARIVDGAGSLSFAILGGVRRFCPRHAAVLKYRITERRDASESPCAG